MGTLRLALCQLDVVVGDVANNVTRVLNALAEAEAHDADIAVFPELALSGYPPEDLLHSPAFLAENAAALRAVEAATKETIAVVGFVESDRANVDPQLIWSVRSSSRVAYRRDMETSFVRRAIVAFVLALVG